LDASVQKVLFLYDHTHWVGQKEFVKSFPKDWVWLMRGVDGGEARPQ